MAWSSRDLRIADGRPLYWAAPRTTIASTAWLSSRLPTSQIRYAVQPATRTAPAITARTRRPRAPGTRSGVGSEWETLFSAARNRAGCGSRRQNVAGPSATVALLVLQAGPAPAGIVSPDACGRRREAGHGFTL